MAKKKKQAPPTERKAVELTVGQLIKKAFFEGYASYQTPCSPFNSVEAAWDDSEAKRIAEACSEDMSGIQGFPDE
jgi:hypothetical protein